MSVAGAFLNGMESHAPVTVGPAHDDHRYLATEDIGWFEETPRLTPAERLLAAPERFAADLEDGPVDAHAGIYAVRPMVVSVPGVGEEVRRVPVAGLTWVAVHPDARRHGVLTEMLRDHFTRTRALGRAVSALHASEPAIYGRHGYGLASLEQEVTLSRGATLVAPHLDDSAGRIRTRLATYGDDGLAERLHALELSCAEERLGSITGTAEFYEIWTRRTPQQLREQERPRVLFAVQDGREVGAALLQRKHKWEKERPAGTLEVFHLVGSAAARLALLRRLVDFDLMGSIVVKGVGADDPLLTWVGGVRATSDVVPYDSLWIRLVDLPAALQARGYDVDCDVVLDVTDQPCPWNTGRWRLLVKDGEASVSATDDEPDLTLAPAVLGAGYLGATNLVTLRDAGHLQEHRPGATLELWRAMRAASVPDGAIGF